MAFGDREDALWEALKPSFKPRLVADPNARFARRLVGVPTADGTGHSARVHRGDPRATLARVVRRTPEVLVKVTGRKKGAKHLTEAGVTFALASIAATTDPRGVQKPVPA